MKYELTGEVKKFDVMVDFDCQDPEWFGVDDE